MVTGDGEEKLVSDAAHRHAHGVRSTYRCSRRLEHRHKKTFRLNKKTLKTLKRGKNLETKTFENE